MSITESENSKGNLKHIGSRTEKKFLLLFWLLSWIEEYCQHMYYCHLLFGISTPERDLKSHTKAVKRAKYTSKVHLTKISLFNFAFIISSLATHFL